MINRRHFVCAAGSLVFAQTPLSAFGAPARYDVLIKGGRVVDPSVRLDGVRDVAIANGRIAAVEPNIAADAADIIDARCKLVVPGLIDVHTHTARTKEGPALVLQDGVTGWIDAGSQGADHIGDTIAVARSSQNRDAC
jgi:dihydroorotase